jgi:protein-S-isoprenylcysteine O-methyltransferase Ste14
MIGLIIVKGITMRAFSLLLAFVAALLLTTTASANLTDDTPPPAPTEVVDPYGDGEDENGLIPDDNGEDIDEELNSQPFADQAAGTDTAPVEQGEVVTQLPDTGSGSGEDGPNWWMIVLGFLIGTVTFWLGVWIAGRR